jgi:uncharacterized membrane protein
MGFAAVPGSGEDEGMRRPGAGELLAGFMAVAGSAHFVVPRTYEAMIPSGLGSARAWVYGSGVVELVCAAGLAVPRTRRLAAWATAVLFVVVFPGNVTMAVDAGGRSAAYQAAAYGRLPVQVPLVWWAVAVARRAQVSGGGRTGRRASRRPPGAGSG